MSTTAEVVTAWNDLIWEDTDILAITPNIFNFEFSALSTKEYARLRHEQQVNAFFYTVTRAERLRLMGQREQKFTVAIEYYKAANVAGTNYPDIHEVFETLDTTIRAELSSNWNETVDFYRNQEGPVSITLIEIESRPIYRGNYSYIGFKNL